MAVPPFSSSACGLPRGWNQEFLSARPSYSIMYHGKLGFGTRGFLKDPNEELIGGTVTVDLDYRHYDQFTLMRLYLAFDATGLGRTELGSASPFEVQFNLPNGTRLDSRDFLLIYPENPYGQQAVPIAVTVSDWILFWNSAPGASSVVQSIQFNDEDAIYRQLSGTVRWVPGSMTAWNPAD
ncbi:unnamed protein product [Symbiodinium natans]|uniref:Uncharacterized protein n=1 Tax=Symbiodinium natans TaxID=878477 RepID=A0A812NN13_9DINO|nr:unnamed protein product [Symbiodinium natans]